MQINIQGQGFTLTAGLRGYLMKRLACSLNHGDDHIIRVTVRLSGINGPRGGADKRCFIEVRLKPGLSIRQNCVIPAFAGMAG